MSKPWTPGVLLAEPANELAGEEGSWRFVGRISRRGGSNSAFGDADGSMGRLPRREIVAAGAEPREPELFVFEPDARREAGKQPLVAGQDRIAGWIVARIWRLVGIAEKRRIIADAASGKRDVVEAPVAVSY